MIARFTRTSVVLALFMASLSWGQSYLHIRELEFVPVSGMIRRVDGVPLGPFIRSKLGAPASISEVWSGASHADGAPLLLDRHQVELRRVSPVAYEMHHRIVLLNPDLHNVYAFGVDFHVFDVFDRYLGSYTGVEIFRPSSRADRLEATWTVSLLTREMWTFAEHGEAIAVLRFVRTGIDFEGGPMEDVWEEADLDGVLEFLHRHDDTVTLEDIIRSPSVLSDGFR